jgi:hypothetical protein
MKADARSGVGLRVAINEQNPFAQLSQTSTQIDCRRRLTHSTFLVDNRHDNSHFPLTDKNFAAAEKQVRTMDDAPQ